MDLKHFFVFALIYVMIILFLPAGQVWKRVWKITFFGLKEGQDPPPPGSPTS